MHLFKISLCFFAFSLFIHGGQNEKNIDREKEVYVCPPCGCAAHAHNHNQIFEHDGTCPYCGLKLIEKTDSSQINQINIHRGSGNFLIEGGIGHKQKVITVFYYKPKSFTSESPILIVIPGSGRDGDEYRDAWIKASKQYGVLILSAKYPEKFYNFGGYHMGGLMHNINIMESVEFLENSNRVNLNEQKFTYSVNSRSSEWIFNDFDRLFNMVAEAVGSSQHTYGIFGHSAGGQILHRFAIFDPASKANRIVASNSGFYTIPTFNETLPFGLKNAPIDKNDLKTSFKKHLILLIGELDNANETGGILLRSPTVDKQGTNRLARAKYFYKRSKAIAKDLGFQFNWKLITVPNIGHDFRHMSKAAAKYLYGGEAPK